MTVPLDITLLTASAAARLLQRKELTAQALLGACLDVIEKRESEVLAWREYDAKAAMRHAQQLDQGPIRGPLHGLPLVFFMLQTSI